jgi:hypothetical protein
MSGPVLGAEVRVAAGILAADGALTTDLTADSATDRRRDLLPPEPSCDP